MAVPNTFANATTSIPLSQLDQNFATAITLGNTAIQLGNTVTTLNNMTLANVTVSTGNVSFTQGTIGGNVVINTTGTANTGNHIVTGTLSVSGAVTQGGALANYAANFRDGTVGGSCYLQITTNASGNAGTDGFVWGLDTASPPNAYLSQKENANLYLQANSATVATVSATGLAVTGALSCTGALSKGSGSFRITHPIPQLSETHQLVHSFIEGPKADLIYRGKVSLVNGAASVNIDSSAGMTEGTFVVLCRDVQCFTTNESDWTPVRGSVAGNVLTIEAQDNTSTASVSWMVIGERQDQHMYETDWTDDDGHVIVEPLKPVTVEVSE